MDALNTSRFDWLKGFRALGIEGFGDSGIEALKGQLGCEAAACSELATTEDVSISACVCASS